ncbi:hypothetical protein [Actinomadura atramentaria]|uniref:hypothetical protein n=1 Tax=Actinomadura atramentaria TaxID=1990 RepID=UPI00037C7E8A|nr:hypothetical protein [Actinomadura atramentaria]
MPVNEQALALAASINKKAGDNAVVLASEIVPPPRFTSGSLALDLTLGGGFPGNQWTEVIGRESHGKTAIVQKTIAANQRRDPDFVTVWVAAEHFDSEQAQRLGIDLDRVIVVPTQDMEYAYDTMLKFAESRSVDAIVLDSYPALIAGEEANKSMEDLVVALGARLTGKFCRKAGRASKRAMNGEEKPLLGIIINQYREKIGGFSPHGPALTTPGGNAKNYFYWTRLEVRRDEWIDEARPGKGTIRVGQTIKAKTIKNKGASPHQIATLTYFFRDAPVLGFAAGDYDTVKEIVAMGILFDVITGAGGWFSAEGHRWHGKEAMATALRSEPELQQLLTDAILARAAAQSFRAAGREAAEVEHLAAA